MFETGIAVARPLGRLRIHFFQIVEHRLDRGVQAVKIEPVEAGLSGAGWKRIVVSAQPPDEVENVRVAPHPGRETLEPGQRLDRVRISALRRARTDSRDTRPANPPPRPPP